jgi:DNA polymerase III epsilon subunit-like protein
LPILLIIDTETTGLSKQDEPIEVALNLVKVSDAGVFIEELQSYCGLRQPRVSISPLSQKIHGIQISELDGMDWDHEMIRQLIDKADILIAHNASFDVQMLSSIYPEIVEKNWRCTYQQWPWPKAKGRKLSNAAEILKIPIDMPHRALGDVNLLKQCLFASSGNDNFCDRLLKCSPFNINKSSNKNTASPEALSSWQRVLDPKTLAKCTELKGLVKGLQADLILVDEEIHYLNHWIENHPELKTVWPVSEVIIVLKNILRDGQISSTERESLFTYLNAIHSASFKTVAQAVQSEALKFDELKDFSFEGKTFCLTGEFLIGEKAFCVSAIESKGGLILNNVSKKLNYLIVGGLGSADWKHGNFGTKVEKALGYRSAGATLKIIHEQNWVLHLNQI